MSIHPEWVTRGKTVRQLIQELQSFEDQDIEVRISVNGGTTHRPISLVGKSNGMALLRNCEEDSHLEVDKTGSAGKSAEKMLAQAIYEIRVLLASYLGSPNAATQEVRQAAHLAYAVHNVALGTINQESANLVDALGAIEAIDKMFDSDYFKSFVRHASGA